MANPLEIAKQHGYTDEEIDEYMGEKNPKYRQALDAGYTREEIQSFFEKKAQPKESLGKNIGRQAGRTGARVVETVLGAPRAFAEFGEMLVPKETLKKVAGKVGLRKPVEKAFELSEKYAPYKLLPKSEDIRENVTKHLFGEKLEPKNEWEKEADTLVSDFAALAVPVPGSQLKLLKPALLAAGGFIASNVVGQLGGTDEQKTYAKLGIIFAGSMINPKSADKLKNDLYEQAREAKPSDAVVTAENLIKNSDNFEKQLLKGDSGATTKKKALSLIEEIKSKVKNNEINVDELEEFKRNINEARASLYDEFKANKVGRKTAKTYLNTISKFIDDTLTEYGATNPEWAAFYRPANEVHGAIVESHKVRGFIARIAKKYGLHAILPALGISHAIGLPGVVGMAGMAAAGTTGMMGEEIIIRFAKSKTLLKHYMNLINSALKEDVVVVHENLKKLKKELEED